MNLIGKTTANGWTLTKKIEQPKERSGGYFSECYEVQRGSEIAFLKALNIEKFQIDEILTLIAGFQYESESVRTLQNEPTK